MTYINTTTRVPWLLAYLHARGGQAPRSDVVAAAARAGLSRGQVTRAAHAAGVTMHRTTTFPAVTVWHAPAPERTQP